MDTHLYDSHDLWDKQNQDILELLSEGAFGSGQDEQAKAKASEEGVGQQDFQLNDDEEQADEPSERSVDKDNSKRQGKIASKACREKARRERLNECYVELAQLVDSSRSPKTDKMSILCDAIKSVKALKVENNQLKQLNKFLEEKVSSQQRDRGQDLYQSYVHLLQQAAVNSQNKQQQVSQGGVDLGQASSSAQVQQSLNQPQQLGISQQVTANPQGSIQQQMSQQLLMLQQMMAAQGLALQPQFAGQAGPSQSMQPQGQLLHGQSVLQAPNQQLLLDPQIGQAQPWFVDPQQDMKLRPPAA